MNDLAALLSGTDIPSPLGRVLWCHGGRRRLAGFPAPLTPSEIRALPAEEAAEVASQMFDSDQLDRLCDLERRVSVIEAALSNPRLPASRAVWGVRWWASRRKRVPLQLAAKVGPDRLLEVVLDRDTPWDGRFRGLSGPPDEVAEFWGGERLVAWASESWCAEAVVHVLTSSGDVGLVDRLWDAAGSDARFQALSALGRTGRFSWPLVRRLVSTPEALASPGWVRGLDDSCVDPFCWLVQQLDATLAVRLASQVADVRLSEVAGAPQRVSAGAAAAVAAAAVGKVEGADVSWRAVLPLARVCGASDAERLLGVLCRAKGEAPWAAVAVTLLERFRLPSALEEVLVAFPALLEPWARDGWEHNPFDVGVAERVVASLDEGALTWVRAIPEVWTGSEMLCARLVPDSRAVSALLGTRLADGVLDVLSSPAAVPDDRPVWSRVAMLAPDALGLPTVAARLLRHRTVSEGLRLQLSQTAGVVLAFFAGVFDLNHPSDAQVDVVLSEGGPADGLAGLVKNGSLPAEVRVRAAVLLGDRAALCDLLGCHVVSWPVLASALSADPWVAGRWVAGGFVANPVEADRVGPVLSNLPPDGRVTAVHAMAEARDLADGLLGEVLRWAATVPGVFRLGPSKGLGSLLGTLFAQRLGDDQGRWVLAVELADGSELSVDEVCRSVLAGC